MARQADAAVFAQYGETSVLATVVCAKSVKLGIDFFPAHRKLPGADLRRGQDPRRLFQARRPPDRKGDADIASHRPPDPSLRSSRASRTEVQVVVTVLSHDLENDPDIVGLVAASAALAALGPAVPRPHRPHRASAYISWRVRAQSDD